MIEVNLFSIPAADVESSVGRCVARSRVDISAMNVSVMEFVKGFIKDNLGNLERTLGNADLVGFLSGNEPMSTVDFATVNYILKKVGYKVAVWNVADDEENPSSVGDGTVEYNVVNYNFIQHEYPTVTKIISSDAKAIDEIVKQIVESTGLYDGAKFKGVKNPFSVLLGNLKLEKDKMANVNSTIVTQVYHLLDQMGFKVFCAVPEA